MRIISGEFGGIRFQPPAKTPARPTTDLAKEGLFNILENLISLDGISSLDLFAGTGSISYELASRGADSLTLVERDGGNLGFIRQMMARLGVEDRFNLRGMDVFRYLREAEGPFDFIFAGPPYALKNIDDIPRLVLQNNLLAAEGIFVLEHTPKNAYESHPGFFRKTNYGTTVFSFFRPQNVDDEKTSTISRDL